MGKPSTSLRFHLDRRLLCAILGALLILVGMGIAMIEVTILVYLHPRSWDHPDGPPAWMIALMGALGLVMLGTAFRGQWSMLHRLRDDRPAIELTPQRISWQDGSRRLHVDWSDVDKVSIPLVDGEATPSLRLHGCTAAPDGVEPPRRWKIDIDTRFCRESPQEMMRAIKLVRAGGVLPPQPSAKVPLTTTSSLLYGVVIAGLLACAGWIVATGEFQILADGQLMVYRGLSAWLLCAAAVAGALYGVLQVVEPSDRRDDARHFDQLSCTLAVLTGALLTSALLVSIHGD